MAQNYTAIKGTPRAIGEEVLVTEIQFGEQTTAGGLILGNDDGKTRGIYPRWGKVYSKGPDNKDEFEVGDWILIAHGRWTRSLKIETTSDGEIEMRKVELSSILAMSKEKPAGTQIGSEYSDGDHATIDPSSFIIA
jgi:co-chaperonin GroES (HSP10)